MKYFFVFIVVVHGLIHLIGFFKAFNLGEFEQLTKTVSKSIGIIWLLSAVILLTVAFLFFVEKEWWWIPAIVAVVASQTLIILNWQDAKFGTIANVMILIGVIVGIGIWSFNKQIAKEINVLQVEQVSEKTIITEQMLEPLPKPVKLWLNDIGIVGKEEIQSVYLKQRGLMRLKPEQKEWTKAQAEQYITTDEPAFLWKVNMEMIPFVHVAGRDLFMNAKGEMAIKIASIIPVVNTEPNEKINQSALQRFLLELPWYPSFALSSYVQWESIDETTAKATITYNGVTGSATFYFNENNELEKISAFRYKESDEDATLIECIGEIKESSIIEGVKIPTKIDISWMLEDGKYTWYRLELSKVRFN